MAYIRIGQNPIANDRISDKCVKFRHSKGKNPHRRERGVGLVYTKEKKFSFGYCLPQARQVAILENGFVAEMVNAPLSIVKRYWGAGRKPVVGSNPTKTTRKASNPPIGPSVFLGLIGTF